MQFSNHSPSGTPGAALARTLVVRFVAVLALVALGEALAWMAGESTASRLAVLRSAEASGGRVALMCQKAAKEALALRAAIRGGRQGEVVARAAALEEALAAWETAAARFVAEAPDLAADAVRGAEADRAAIAEAAGDAARRARTMTLGEASDAVDQVLAREGEYAAAVDDAMRALRLAEAAERGARARWGRWSHPIIVLVLLLAGAAALSRPLRAIREAMESARAEEEARRAMFECSPAPMLLVDAATLEIAEANPAAAAFYGYDAETLKRRTLSDFGERERSAALEEIARASVSGSAQFEAWHRLANGDRRAVLAQCSAVTIRGRLHAHAIIADITERKRVEEELRLAGERYRAMFERTAAAKLLIDPSLDAIVDANAAACAFYGHSRDSLKAKRMSDLEERARAEAVREIARAGLESETRFESRHRVATGETRDVEVFCGPVEVDGRPLINAIVVDITERKRAERRLRGATAQLQAVFASLPDLFFTLDAEGAIRDYQCGSPDDLLQPPSRFMGRRVEEIVPPDEGRAHLEAFEKSRRERALVTLEYSLDTPAGGRRHYESRYLPMGDDNTLIAIRNITEKKRAAEALALNERRYRAMFELSPAGVALTTDEGTLLHANQAFLEIAGRQIDESSKLKLADLLPRQTDRESLGSRLLSASRGETTEEVAVVRREDGELRHVEFRHAAIPLFDGGKGALTIATDITERLKRDETLRRQAAIMEAMTDGVALFDPRGRIVSVNPAMARMAGKSAEALAGSTAAEAWCEAPEEDDGRAGERAAANVRLVDGAGRERFASLRAFALTSAEEEPILVAIYRDVSAQQRAERALRESERRLRDFLDNANDLIHMVDERGRLVYANRCWREKLGYALEGEDAPGMFDILAESSKEHCAAVFRELLEGKPASGVEATFLAADGREIPVEGNIAARREEGKPVLTLGIFRDATERKRAEEEQKRGERRLRTLYSISKDLELDDDEQISTALAKAADYLGQSFGYVNGLDGNCCVLEHLSPNAPEGIGFERGCRAERDDTYCGVALASGDVVAIERMGESPWRGRRRYVETGMESHLGVALRVGGRLYGALGFSRLEPRTSPWTEDDKQFARLLAELMARALERRESREALRRSEERYRAVVEEQTEMVCRFRPDATITFANEAFARSFRQARERLRGRKFVPVLPPDERRRWREAVGALTLERPTTSLVLPIGSPLGGRRWQEWTIRLIAPGDAATAEYQAVGRDVTDRRAAEEALAASELKLRFIVENTADAIFIKDVEGRYALMNASGAALFGLAPEEVRGRTDAELFGAGEGAKPREDDLRAMREGKLLRLEEEYTVGGRHLQFSTQKFPFLADDGRLLGVIGIAHDVSRLREAERETRRAKESLERIVNGSLDMIVSVDARGRVTEFNPAAERAFGAAREQVVGKSIRLLLASGPLPLAAPGSPDEFVGEVECLRSDGSRFPALVSAKTLRDADGSVVGSVGIARDITERKRADEELRATRDRLEMALLGSDLGLWDWDVETGRVHVNERWASMLGYPMEEVEPRVEFWEGLIHPADQSRVLALLGSHLAGETAYYQAELRLRMKSGEWKWVLDSGKVVERSDDGRPLRAVGTHQDIDERKRSEAALQAAERERGEFYRFLVHDLNKPLAAIVGFSERLCAPASALTGRPAKYAETALNAALRMRDIVGQFMQFEQLRRGDITLHPVEFNAWMLVADIARLLADRHEGRLVLLGGKPPEAVAELPPARVVADQVCFGRVAQNLLDNALKYGDSRAEVEIEARPKGGFVLSIWNDGGSIAPEERERVFAEYYRSPSRPGVEGYGLGLSASARLAKLLGGRVWIGEPAEGKGGAIFLFEAPGYSAKSAPLDA